MNDYRDDTGVKYSDLILRFRDRSEAQGILRYLMSCYKRSGKSNGKNPKIKLSGKEICALNIPAGTIDDVIGKIFSRVPSSRVSHEVMPVS